MSHYHIPSLELEYKVVVAFKQVCFSSDAVSNLHAINAIKSCKTKQFKKVKNKHKYIFLENNQSRVPFHVTNLRGL